MLEHSSPANRYREVAVKTANPLQLVLMLYDAAICSLQEARECINRRDIAGRSRSLNKCIAIISELHSCLNIKEGGEIASSLDRLYDYMKRMIFRANVEQSAQPLAEIESLLENLRSAWSGLIAQMGGNGMQPHGSESPNLRAPLAEALAAAPQKSFNISA
jgi:flagellar secretion chaperone FliS